MKTSFGYSWGMKKATKPPTWTAPRATVRLSSDLRKRLRLECVKRDVTVQKALEEAIKAWLDRGPA